MRLQYASLVALFLDSVTAVSVRRGAEDIFLQGTGTIEKRAESTTIPAPINVEPSQYWEGNDGTWSTFEIQVGTPKQNVRVMISTAGYATWTINEAGGCPNGTIVGCEANRGQPFLTNESLTWVPNSIWTLGLEDNLGLDTTAYFGFDTVTLGWQGSGLPTAEHMVIANLAVNTYWFGQFGLNPQGTNFSNFNDPQQSFMTAMKNNNTIPSLSWAYTAGAHYRFSGVYGSLVLGGYDVSKFNATNMTIPFAGDVSRDLLVGVQDITTSTETTSLSASSGGFYAFIDSTLPYYWLPESVCEAFEAAFGITWDEDTELYLVNDTLHTTLLDLNPTVTFTLGESSSGGQTVDVVLPYAAFDLDVAFPIVENSTHYFPLKRAANSTQYTLGRAFLQEAYLIADYERRNFTVAPCKWVENADSQIKTIFSVNSTVSNGSSNDSHGISGGAIAGIVVGVVGGIAVIAAIVWFFLRRKRDKKRIAELEAKTAAGVGSGNASDSENGGTAYSDTAAKPFISHPIGGELGNDSEIHEMQAQYKAPPSEMGGANGLHEYYGTGVPKFNADGTMSTVSGGVGTWQSGLSEVEGNNEPIYEMMGSEVQELPDSRRQSWADGEDSLGPRGTTAHSQPTLPPSYVAEDYPKDEKTGLH